MLARTVSQGPAGARHAPPPRCAWRTSARHYGPTIALDGLDLTIQPGELVALLGPSGCGKTTALRLVAGLEDADAGRVVIDGRDVTQLPASRRDTGMVFQAYSLFPHMTARENVAFGLRMRKVGTRSGGARRGRCSSWWA